MNPSREATLFAAALQKSAAERNAFLDGACHEDPNLRRRIEALLEADENPDQRIEADNPARSHDGLQLNLAGLPAEEAVGQSLGPYKLLEKLGEGGCGVVYVAEQTHPVRRRVAMKVIKLGMDTKQVVARFEAERQALAMMDHPNIARVLDAGSTATGRPYFVMELVRGIRVTDYCDRANLSPHERLSLFIKICQAIQHAHQKGIIHRDIKPSNILVTLHDGVPVPKVIDFGIAKAVEGRLTDATVYTQLHHFIGTPAYISPEQAEMSGLDIDTRSDIYSLGVLLYELLTGRTPFDGEKLVAAGLDGMRQTIREQEPERPSTRLATCPGAELTTVAKRRSLESGSLVHLLRGDLDWIVMKCLEKDRSRRYDTANGLAMDIVRYLNNEPVVARPPSTLYRFEKAFRRNRIAFSAGLAVAAALLVGAIASAWQARLATRQRRVAEANEARAIEAERLAANRLKESEAARSDSEAIAQFLTSVFRSPDPSRDGRSITVAETLGRAAQQLETNLLTQPAHRARLQTTLGRTYLSLSLARDAVPLFEKARDYHTTSAGPEHPATLRAMGDLVQAYLGAGRIGPAVSLGEDWLRLCRKVHGPDHAETVRAMAAVSQALAGADRQAESLQLKKEVLAWNRRVKGEEHLDTIRAMAELARTVGSPTETLRLNEEILSLQRKVQGTEHPDTIVAMANLALSYSDNGRKAEGIRWMEETLALSRKVYGPEHRMTLLTMGNLAVAYAGNGMGAKGIPLLEETLAIRRRTLGTEHPDTLGAMGNLAAQFSAIGQADKAVALWEETLPLRRKIVGPEHMSTLLAMEYLARAYAAAGRKRESLSMAREALELRWKIKGPNDPTALDALQHLEAAYVEAGRIGDAEKLRDEYRAFGKPAAER